MPALKLAALDAEDLKIVSAHVQDALVTAGDMRYLPREKRFFLAIKRFAWEEAAKGTKKTDERRVSVLNFDRVLGVKTRGVDPRKGEAIHDLLAFTFDEGEAPAGTIRLAFAGGGELALDVECIEVSLTDTKAAWKAGARPDHGLQDEDA